MTIVKQSVGIDIAKKDFTACISILCEDRSISHSEDATFDNNKTGFNKFIRWVSKHVKKDVAVFYFMEATGTYYESLAYHLNKLNKNVSVVLPNKVNHFGKSLNVKSKTDPEDARVISIMGVERELDLWSPPAPIYKKLRSLTRLYSCLQKDKTMTSNRLGALNSSFEPEKLCIKTYKSIVDSLEKKLSKIESEIEKVLKSDAELWSKVEKIHTIPGIGIKTIGIILGETQGFELIKNQRQLVSYCGLDVTQKQSGTSVNGKARISKKGNSNIRAALYFPAMSAAQHNKQLKKAYERINKNKPNKMTGIVALERRLLVLMYSLWKSNKPYMEDYEQNRISGYQIEEGSSSSSTRRVEKADGSEKVDGVRRPQSTQNEHLYEQTSDALLRL